MKKGLPPPFHGPGGGTTEMPSTMQTIYYQPGYQMESGIFGPPATSSHHHNHHHTYQRQKSKKSFAEKIGRSLVDKLSPGQKESRTGCRAHGPSGSQQQLVPTYVYPVQYGSPVGYGNHHQQSANSLHYPWEIYNGQIIEYHDLSYSPGAAQSPCACQEFVNLTGTLRGRPKCKKCRRPRTNWSPPVNHPVTSSPYAKKLQQQDGVAPVPKKNLVYRDPYEYHGQQIVGGRKVRSSRSEADEWQAYWDQEEDDDFVDAKASAPFIPSGLASKIRPRSKSPEPFRHLRVRKPNSVSDLKIVERAIATQNLNKSNHLVKNLSTFSPQPNLNQQTKNGQNSFDQKRILIVDNEENSERSCDHKSNKTSEGDQAFEEEESGGSSDSSTSSAGPQATSPQPTRKLPIVPCSNEPNPDEKSFENNPKEETIKPSELESESSSVNDNNDESESEFAKGLIDETTRRKLIEDAESLLVRSELRRPKKLRSSDYRLRRKYQQQQRRKNAGSSSGSSSSSSATSFLIDEVILEEDEEALEAENLEVISSRPPVPVKSILKRPSQTSSSSSDSDTDSSPKSSREENEGISGISDSDVSPTSTLSSTDSTSLVRRRKKGVTFNTETVTSSIEMGNVASDASLTTTTTTNITTTTPSRRQQQQQHLSYSETEDELTGYSKVVVSHNLAEEILDEIYGKMSEAAVEAGQSTEYENADFFSSAAPPFFLFHDSEAANGSEPPRSLADEILDELYGGDLKFDENDESTKTDDDENDFYEEIRDLSTNFDKNSSTLNDVKKMNDIPPTSLRNVNPVLAELSRRFHRRQVHNVPAFALGPVQQSQQRRDLLRADMASLFNDTTRLRLKIRPSLAANMFFNEAPSTSTVQTASGGRSDIIYNDEQGNPALRRLPPRPKEPPPPPPPVSHVLLPVTTPRKFMPSFTSEELTRINDVINGRRNDVIREEDEDLIEEGSEAGDEFSSDEFSDGEFDSLSNTYENLSGLIQKRSSPEGTEDTIDDNVYDVAEFVENSEVVEQEQRRQQLSTVESESSQKEEGKIVDKTQLSSIDDSNQLCLIENEGEKTIIFTSAAVASSQSKHHHQSSCNNGGERSSSHLLNVPAAATAATTAAAAAAEKSNNRSSNAANNTSEHQILISSSSWIDLQGNNSSADLKSEENSRNCDSPAFGSLPLVSCKLGGSLPSDVCKLEVGSISIGGKPHGSEWAVSADPGITLDSLEPVKPPRLKKIARLQQQQQQQQLHHQQQQHHHDLLRHVMQREKFKMSNRPLHHHHHNHHHQQQHSQQRQHPRPDISAPILLATTLNPNDADAHRTLSAFSAGSILSHLEQLNRQQRHLPPLQQQQLSQNQTRSLRGERITTFRDLKRTLASSFSGSFPASHARIIRGLAGGSQDGFSVGRSSFYEAEAVYDEAQSRPVSANSPYPEHIYEEIPEHMHRHHRSDNSESIGGESASGERPLPPIPERSDSKPEEEEEEKSSDELSSKQPRRRAGSFFEGASKYEILLYLRDAKDRIGYTDFEIELENEDDPEQGFIGRRNAGHRVSSLSHLSDSSACSSNSGSGDGSVLHHLPRLSRFIDIERTDSGVGSETSKTSKASVEIRRAASISKSSDSGSSGPENIEEQNCQDCDQEIVQEGEEESSDRLASVVCKKCAKRRSERKEIITEIVETEIKYGRDLRIIVEEFYRPMLVAGLLTSEQLAAIFLNVDELIQVNSKFTESLRDAIEIAYEQGDEDLCTVRIGKHFFDSLFMLRAFESYCTRQGTASLLLTTLEKEKELLRIFLKVSQMENSMLRRMNLSSFLMVPVQRVTKYPLLLSRLYKVTPYQHEDRNTIKLSQERIEAALEQMNKDAKDVVNSSKLWRRLPMMTSSGSSSPSKKLDVQDELSNIKIQKMALEALGWKSEDTRFPLEGRILYTQPNEANWKKVWTVKLTPINAVLAVLSNDQLPEVTPNKELIFPSDSANIKDAYLVIVREKNSRYTLVRDPLPLDHCVICCEQDWDDCFEIQEFVNKESYVFKGEEPEQTQMWFQTLQFYTQSLGGWRKRRKGLGNIMIDPNLVIPPATPTSTPVSTPTPNDAEGAAGGAAAPADAVSLAAEALEKETE